MIEYNGVQKSAGRDNLTITNMSAVLITTQQLADANQIIWLKGDENIVSISFDVQYINGIKSYNYRLRLNTPITNK